MANMKNVMIDSLRDSTENEQKWRLRKVFLDKNLQLKDGPEYKDHIIMLSHCFVRTSLAPPTVNDYPQNIVQEMQSRSWGLEGGGNQAQYGKQDTTTYQSSQAPAATSYYQRPKHNVNSNSSYDYNQRQNQQDYSSQYQQGQDSGSYYYDQNQGYQSSGFSYDQNQQNSSSYGQGFQSATPYGQNNQQSSVPYGQNNQQSSALYGQNQQNKSYQGQGYHSAPNGQGQKPFGQNQQGNEQSSRPFGQNQNPAKSLGQNQQSAKPYGQNQQSAKQYGQNQQSSTTYVNQSASSSYSQDDQFSAPSYGQDQQHSSYEYDSSISSYGQHDSSAHPYDQQGRQTSPYKGQYNDPAAPAYQNSNAFRDGKKSSKSQFPKPIPKRVDAANVDTNALSVIPRRPNHPNKGVPKGAKKKGLSKKAQRKAEKKKVLKNHGSQNIMSHFTASTVWPARTEKQKIISPRQEVALGVNMGYKHLQPTFKEQPLLFDYIVNVPFRFGSTSKAKAPGSKDGDHDVSVPAKTSSDEAKDKDGHLHDPPSSTTTSKEEEEMMMKLSPIFSMADFYSDMAKESSIDPFQTLQKCAAATQQKIRCETNSSINSEGQKELKCQIFINEMSLVSVTVPGGTKPDEAKKKLATAVLEKISLPYLRLVADGKGVLNLEGSKKPFATGEKKGAGDDKAMSGDRGVNEEKDAGPTKKQVKKPPPPAKRFVYLRQPTLNDFDSYIAWRCEKNNFLKKIRQLGHMYITLPYKTNSFQEEEDPVAILQCLINVSRIKLAVRRNEQQSQGGDDDAPYTSKYSMVLDGRARLHSWDEMNEDTPYVVSKEVLKKVSMPFLYLNNYDCLQASTEPFISKIQDWDGVLDTWQTSCSSELRREYSTPARHKDFCLTQTQEHPERTLLDSAKANYKKVGVIFKNKDKHTNTPAHCLLSLNGRNVGGYIGRVAAKVIKNFKNGAAVNAIKNLRKCHWTIHRNALPKDDKVVYPGDILKDHPDLQQSNVQTESKALESSNVGHKLLSKMGWSGGGVGLNEDGIQDPISVGDVAKSSGISCREKRGARRPNVSSMVDCSNIDHEELLDAYDKSCFHRDLYIPCKFGNQRGKIFRLAESLDMTASTRGISANKRVLVSKNLDGPILIFSCVKRGGKSDKFTLIPPQEVNHEPVVNLFNEVPMTKKELKRLNMPEGDVYIPPPPNYFPNKGSKKKGSAGNTKAVQCCRLRAPPLELFEPTKSTEIVYDPNDPDDDCGDGEEQEEMEGYEEDDVVDADDDSDGFGHGGLRRSGRVGQQERKRKYISKNYDEDGYYKRPKDDHDHNS